MTACQLPGKVRVLVVDDDKDTADSAALILSGQGLEALPAYDAQTGLRLAGTAPAPRVVLLDLAMPRVNGYQFARDLRALPDMEKALILCVSGYGMEADIQRSREAGCNHHFLKPVDWNEVLAMIHNHLGRS